MKTNLKKTKPGLYRARALRQAFRKLGHDLPVAEIALMMWNTQVCTYCGNQIAPLDFSIDHKTPKERGGSNDMDNLHLICKKCNSVKGSLDDAEMKALMDFLSDYPNIYENLYKRLRMANLVFTFRRKK